MQLSRRFYLVQNFNLETMKVRKEVAQTAPSFPSNTKKFILTFFYIFSFLSFSFSNTPTSDFSKIVTVKFNDFSELDDLESQEVKQIIFHESDLNYIDSERWLSFTRCERIFIRSTTMRNFPEAIANIPNLRILEIYTSKLTYIPQSLEYMTSLQEIQLSTKEPALQVDASFYMLPNLKRLKFHASNILEIPPSILETTTVRYLKLYLPEVKTFPTEIYQMERMEELELELFGIHDFPEGIGNLKYLKKLKLDAGYNSGIQLLPLDFDQLMNLNNLDLTMSQLEALPDNFGQLTALKHAELIVPNLQKLPSSFSELPNLNWLFLSVKALKELPSNFNELPLRYFRLTFNHLPTFEGVFSHVKVLHLQNLYKKEPSVSELDLSGFQAVYNLEVEFFLSGANIIIPEENALKKINLKKCKLKSIPESFKNLALCEELDLTSNELSSLPSFLFDLPLLKKIQISGNPIDKSLVEKYREQSNLQIIKYY